MSKQRGLYKQKGSNNWFMCFANENGKTVRKTTGTSDWREARDKRTGEINLVKEVKAGREKRKPEIGKHSFEELCEDYLKFCAGKKQARTSTKVYILELFKKRFGKDTLISNLCTLKTFEDLQAELLDRGLDSKRNLRADALLQEGKGEGRQGMSEHGVDMYMGIFKSMMGKAASWHWILREDFDDVCDEFEMLNPDGRDRYLTEEEINKLLSVCDFEDDARHNVKHLRPIILSALHTGMRKSEILKLTWPKIDLVNGFIGLPWTSTKTKKNRKVPIDQVQRAVFESLPRYPGVAFVYPNPETMAPFTDIKNSFNYACERAGLNDVHFHDLRHTFASHYAMNNGELKVLQEILGHASSKQTNKYAHLSDKYRRSATSAMDRMPGGNFVQKPTEEKILV